MLIVFEGVDGSGKSTQMDRFCQFLTERELDFLRCADPGTTPLGNAVREVLLHRRDLAIDPVCEMLLFMASRAQMVAEVIAPALAERKIVVCDRFVMSTMTYQGFAGDIDLEQIRQVANVATSGVVPDLTVVLDLPVDDVARRIGQDQDRMESRSRSFFESVVNGYRQLTELDPNAHLIDATQSMDEIQSHIVKLALASGVGSEVRS